MEKSATQMAKMPVRPTLRGMGVGEKVSFPASQTKSVKVSCSDLAFELNRVYKTTQNRETRTLDVVRTQ